MFRLRMYDNIYLVSALIFSDVLHKMSVTALKIMHQNSPHFNLMDDLTEYF